MKYWWTISGEEQVERWENVLRVLREMTPHERRKHWDMGTWGEKTECGTVACAAGRCGLDSWFRRRGFRMTFSRYAFENQPGEIEYEWNSELSVPASDFFGHDGTQKIFLNGHRRSVGKVIKEVEAYIEELKQEVKADEAA